jgi:ferredoxin
LTERQSVQRGRGAPRAAWEERRPDHHREERARNRPSRLLLRVNPIACDGHGLCAELLPEVISRDDWGYPIPITAEIPPHLEAHAERAAQACPTLAIVLERQRRRRTS